MTGRNKGFDPLSSLFDAPDPARGVPLPDIADDDLGPDPGAKLELTDPFVKRPLRPPESVRDLAPRPHDQQDKAALARKLALAALARVSPTPQDESPAPAPAPAPAPDLPASQDAGAVDKQDLARRLAAAAVAAAAAQAETPVSAPPTKQTRASAGRSRVASLAARARKPVSALAAARMAVRDEEERQAHELRMQANHLRDIVQDLVPEWLPGIGTVYVANAIAVQQRDLLQGLWRGHRSKFLADGELERAVGAAAVLAALAQAPEGALVAAHAVTDASDYLVWLDLDKGSLVAAFSNARAYFAPSA